MGRTRKPLAFLRVLELTKGYDEAMRLAAAALSHRFGREEIAMPLILDWQTVALRLVLAFIAGGLVGLDRSERGQAAGLRTTILVCLAAAASMIQANLLLPTVGKASDSFVVLDAMRLPLGILSGMGFIGAGAILRRGDRVRGVTTAATLWFVTVLGLCFGGGQIALGLALLILGLAVLSLLGWAETKLRLDRHATLIVMAGEGGPGFDELRGKLMTAGLRVGAWSVDYDLEARQRTFRCELQGGRLPVDMTMPDFVAGLRHEAGVLRLHWQM